MARAASGRARLSLYFHTCELFEFGEARRLDPRSLMRRILALARPGDILGHVDSAMPTACSATTCGPHRRADRGRRRRPAPWSYTTTAGFDYSLAGAFARLVALGMPFGEAVAAMTVNPARVLGDAVEIGTS